MLYHIRNYPLIILTIANKTANAIDDHKIISDILKHRYFI